MLACVWVGVQVPETVYDRPSQKLRCPFGEVSHDDFGVEPAFRVYQYSKSAFCFAGCGYFRPVSLCAMAWDMDPESTAKELLRRVGWREPSSQARWDDLSREAVLVDRYQLTQALMVYASRKFDNWPACRYDESGVSGFLSRCLGLLEHVVTPAQAKVWRDKTKQAVDQFAAQQQGARR